MLKKIDVETKVGGICAAIAIVAGIFEMAFNGFTADVIAGGIKDIFSTLVGVMVFIIAIRSIARNTPKKLIEQLKSAFDNWEKANEPLIFKVTGFIKAKEEKYEQGFCILQNQSEFLKKSVSMSADEKAKYSSYHARVTGKFVDLPNYESMLKESFTVKFNFIASTYGGNVDNFVTETVDCLNGRFKEMGYSATKTSTNNFIVSIPQIEKKEQIQNLINLLDFTLLVFVIQS